jgi:hypothetical protein
VPALAVNWFEGGRRISKLLMALVAAGGAVVSYEAYDPRPVVASRGPTMPWFVNDEVCKYPSYERTLVDYDWGGKKPGLTLCFLALDNGKIPYAVAPMPPEEKAKEEAEDRTREARNEPPIVRLTAPWFYTDDSYSARVSAYTEKAVADLKIEPQLRERLTSTSWRWRAFKRALDQVFPWVVGLCVGIWLITAVIGWIVRGFTGVPTSIDFRPKADGDA